MTRARYQHDVAFTYPMLFTGVADVLERWDHAQVCFRIDGERLQRSLRPLFGYRGRFQAEWLPIAPGLVPRHILPVREESRD